MNRRQMIAASAAGMAALGSSPIAAAGERKDTAARLDDYLRPFVDSRDFSGLVIMTRGGRTIAERTYGFSNFELETAHTRNTRYAAASVGKQFTRAAVLELERKGKLNQQDPLVRHLPQYPGAENITLRQLIDHQGGVSRDLDLGADRATAHSAEELVAMVARTTPAGPVGKTVYSNNGYRILARVIETAGGGVYGDLVRELVFQPRGMGDTLEPDIMDVVPRAASGYLPGPGWGTLEHPIPTSLKNYQGPGSFVSTPADLLRFALTLPLEARDLDEATRTKPDGSPKPRTVGHDGLGQGFANLCYRYPDEDACLIFMGNIETGIFPPIHADFREILFGNPVERPYRPTEQGVLDRVRAGSLEGDYELRPGAPLIIRLQAKGLMVSAGDGFQPLIAMGGDDYFMRQKFARIRFNRDAGQVRSLTWSEAGGEFTLRKLK